MISNTLNERERAEIKRSAAEATHMNRARLVANETQMKCYLAPAPQTVYPLEYSYYLLGDVRGKTVLEYGCGDGLNTAMLARRGAKVIALDISPDLIEVARQRLAANHITSEVEFIVGSAHDLPIADDSVDVVFGMAILHHLDLALSAREVRRVLRRGGRAIFQEPVRNSKAIKLLRSLIPYKAPDVSPFERPLTDEELIDYGREFSSYQSKPFNLPTTILVSVLPLLRERLIHSCFRWDAAILQRLPALARYAIVRVIEVAK